MQNPKRINCQKPLAKINIKPPLKKPKLITNCGVFDIKECSDEPTLIPIQHQLQDGQQQKCYADHDMSYELLWDLESRSCVKMKSTTKNNSINYIEEIVIQIFDESSESAFDMLKLFADIGI
ncbi:Hypothetical_protein [Hexamita inflata]|uniref:Hypothetical_protein n=1 Tax=Hexamita inflata TaxID=28002 RepID=A0ABP1GGT7_9EUKA